MLIPRDLALLMNICKGQGFLTEEVSLCDCTGLLAVLPQPSQKHRVKKTTMGFISHWKKLKWLLGNLWHHGFICMTVSMLCTSSAILTFPFATSALDVHCEPLAVKNGFWTAEWIAARVCRWKRKTTLWSLSWASSLKGFLGFQAEFLPLAKWSQDKKFFASSTTEVYPLIKWYTNGLVFL